MEAIPLRAWASVIVTVKFFAPAVVSAPMVEETENTLSPDTASPFVPSSKNVCEAEPPIPVRFPTTVIPVLDGLLPGDTLTVSRVVAPALIVDGVAAPVTDGLVVP